MYDGIAQQSPTLPPGVQLPEVLEGASEGEVAEVLASIPPKGEAIKAHQLIAAGGVPSRRFVLSSALQTPQMPKEAAHGILPVFLFHLLAASWCLPLLISAVELCCELHTA